MVKYSDSNLDVIFAALSDKTRREILSTLTGRPISVSEIASPFDMSLPAISKHLSVLEKAGLIIREKSGRVHYCRLIAGPMSEASDWLEFYRAFWTNQLDNLEEYLNSKKKKGATNGRNSA